MLLRLETSEGERNIFELKEPAKPLPTDKKDFVYASVVLRKEGVEELSGLPDAYDGTQQQAATKHLKAKLQGRLSSQAQDESEWLTFDIEFTPKSVLARLDKDDAESPRVNYFDIELGTSIFGTYRVDKFALVGGDPELVQLYQSGSLFYTKRLCETPGGCRLEILAITYQNPVRYRAQLCASSCDGLADSKPYDTSSGLAKPTAHDQAFTLDKNTLTGTYHIETGGNPPEPANVYYWRDLKAQFKGAKMTGTIVANQLVYDVVNNKMVNVRTVSMTVSFEATKVK